MRIGIAGGGRAGCHLAHHLSQGPADQLIVWSRQENSRKHLQDAAGKAKVASSLEDMASNVDLLILAFSDDALADLARPLTGGSVKLIHLSGVHGLEVFGNDAENCAAIHPPMALGQNSQGLFPDLKNSLWTLQSGLEEQKFFFQFLKDRSLKPVLLPVQTARQRAEYHAACVMSANLVHALVALSQSGLERSGVPAEHAAALVQQLVTSVLPAAGSSAGLTGPVRRGDLQTINRHLLVLQEADPAAAKVYRTLSLVLLDQLEKDDVADGKKDQQKLRDSLTRGEALS